jgi:hypothetical protein
MSSRKANLSPLRLEARASLNAKPMSLPAVPLAATSGHQAQRSIQQMREPIMIRTLSLTLALVLSLIVPASAQDNKPAQTPSQNAQSKDACRSTCEAQYNQDKECQEGVAPMHSPCEIFDQCLNDCK